VISPCSYSALLFQRAHRPEFGRIADVTVDKADSYMIGNILISLIAGLAAFVALTVLGVPFSVPLAFVVAVTDLIPMIGHATAHEPPQHPDDPARRSAR
jgi:predicted PurR-regulated permease PerM